MQIDDTSKQYGQRRNNRRHRIFLKKQAGRPSGPAPVDDFNFKIIFRIVSGVMTILCMPGSSARILDSKTGRSPLSATNTE